MTFTTLPPEKRVIRYENYLINLNDEFLRYEYADRFPAAEAMGEIDHLSKDFMIEKLTEYYEILLLDDPDVYFREEYPEGV